MEQFQVEVKLAKPRSPWTGGRFERVIQSLKQMLAAKLDHFPDYSVELGLKICLFDYNTLVSVVASIHANAPNNFC